jgi:hypothetical protein
MSKIKEDAEQLLKDIDSAEGESVSKTVKSVTINYSDGTSDTIPIPADEVPLGLSGAFASAEGGSSPEGGSIGSSPGQPEQPLPPSGMTE